MGIWEGAMPHCVVRTGEGLKDPLLRRLRALAVWAVADCCPPGYHAICRLDDGAFGDTRPGNVTVFVDTLLVLARRGFANIVATNGALAHHVIADSVPTFQTVLTVICGVVDAAIAGAWPLDAGVDTIILAAILTGIVVTL